MTEPPQQEERRGPARWRLLALVGVFALSFALAKLTGLGDQLTLEGIRTFMEGAGALGFFAFLAIFALGELLHVPGVVFVAAAIVAYGPVLGGIAGYLGALASVSVSFFVVRGVGGQQLAAVRRPFIQRMLARLDAQPVRVVALLRVALWMAPPLNYALAMSSVRFRAYLIGSALGLALPLTGAAIFIDALLRFIR
ncbi:MAG: VTT domain-containing protein [Myxococcota bacterium]